MLRDDIAFVIYCCCWLSGPAWGPLHNLDLDISSLLSTPSYPSNHFFASSQDVLLLNPSMCKKNLVSPVDKISQFPNTHTHTNTQHNTVDTATYPFCSVYFVACELDDGECASAQDLLELVDLSNLALDSARNHRRRRRLLSVRHDEMRL